MKDRSHTVTIDDLSATASWIGASWGVLCWEGECNAHIVGYRGERVATIAAAHHLMWHINGKPTCQDCGAWLAYRRAKRCRKGTCEGTR